MQTIIATILLAQMEENPFHLEDLCGLRWHGDAWNNLSSFGRIFLLIDEGKFTLKHSRILKIQIARR